MIPRSQHFRDRAPFPFDRSGIMRIFEEARSRSSPPHRSKAAPITPGSSRMQASRRTRAAGLAARKHIVADRDGHDRPRLEQPLVDSLETAAQDRHSGAGGELAHQALGQRLAARGHGQQRRFGPPLEHMVDRRRRARPPASPSPPRPRPACRRPSDACRSRNRGSAPSRATRCRRPRRGRPGCARAARETSPDRG